MSKKKPAPKQKKSTPPVTAAQPTDEVSLVYEPLSSVKRWPRNPKAHKGDLLAESATRFGYTQPLMIDERSGQLVAGHGRLEMLTALKESGAEAPRRIRIREDGEWMVPVLRGVSFKDEAEAEAYLLADNRIGELGGWDHMVLAEITTDLVAADGEVSLVGIGFTGAEVQAFATMRAAETGGAPPGAKQPEFTEKAADDVKYLECPACHHKFPA